MLPTELTIGAHRYTVTTDKDLLRFRDERGNTDLTGCKIEIAAGMAHTATAETLLHETLHAAWNQTGLISSPTGEHEELIVTALAPVILGLLRANPPLVAFLTAAP